MRWLLVLVAIAVVAVGGYLVLQNGQPGPSPSPSPTVAPTRTATPSPSPSPSPTPSPSPSPSPSPTPSPTPAPTPTTFVSPDGYSLTFPALWWVVPLAEGDIAPLLTLLGSTQPGIADLVRTYLDLSGAKASVVGVDLDPDHATQGLPPNANVVIQPTAGLSQDFVAGFVGSILGQLPGVQQPITQEAVSLPAGPAVRFTFQVVTTNGSGETVNGTLRTYLLTRDTNAYLMTFVTSADQADRDLPIFDAIAQSFAFH